MRLGKTEPAAAAYSSFGRGTKREASTASWDHRRIQHQTTRTPTDKSARISEGAGGGDAIHGAPTQQRTHTQYTHPSSGEKSGGRGARARRVSDERGGGHFRAKRRRFPRVAGSRRERRELTPPGSPAPPPTSPQENPAFATSSSANAASVAAQAHRTTACAPSRSLPSQASHRSTLNKNGVMVVMGTWRRRGALSRDHERQQTGCVRGWIQSTVAPLRMWL